MYYQLRFDWIFYDFRMVDASLLPMSSYICHVRVKKLPKRIMGSEEKINETRLEYIKRVNSVLDFIEVNLDEDLSLENLASKAYFSPFHFHRIFSAMVGETLNSFVVRKRIEKIATILLIGTDEPLNDLAFRYGFNSANSFSRTFRNMYGVSPTDFKKGNVNGFRKNGIELITLEQYFCNVDNLKNWLNMNANMEVKELSEIKLAGITSFGDFENTQSTYERLFGWAVEKELLNNPDLKVVTIYYDNPKVTEMSKVRHSECITVNNDFVAEGEISKISIPKGKYVTGHFEIPAGPSFQKAWDSVYLWVIENGYKFRDGSYFELYYNDHRTHPEQKFIVDICIPIE